MAAARTLSVARPVRGRPASGARAARGFSLIELALLIAILALVLGGLLLPLRAQVDASRYEEVREQMRQAQEALIGYVIAADEDATPGVDRRLPCPDTDGDGLPETPPCAVEGFLPHVTLGLPAEDPWGNRFRYRADQAFTAAAGVGYPAAAQSGIEVETRDFDNNPATTVLLTPDSSSGVNPHAPAFVVFSCGKNGVADGENNGDGASAPTARCGAPATIEATPPYRGWHARAAGPEPGRPPGPGAANTWSAVAQQAGEASAASQAAPASAGMRDSSKQTLPGSFLASDSR